MSPSGPAAAAAGAGSSSAAATASASEARLLHCARCPLCTPAALHASMHTGALSTRQCARKLRRDWASTVHVQRAVVCIAAIPLQHGLGVIIRYYAARLLPIGQYCSEYSMGKWHGLLITAGQAMAACSMQQLDSIMPLTPENFLCGGSPCHLHACVMLSFNAEHSDWPHLRLNDWPHLGLNTDSVSMFANVTGTQLSLPKTL